MNNLFFQSASLTQKLLVVFAALFIVSCSSNKAKEEAETVEEPTVVTTPIDQAEESVAEVVEQEPAPVLESVFYFEFDESALTSATRAALDAQAAYLRGNDAAVRLEGHADERGTREYNLALGERRAKAIADYLAIQGISRARMEVVSYGEERPVALGSDESSWAANRRVELK